MVSSSSANSTDRTPRTRRCCEDTIQICFLADIRLLLLRTVIHHKTMAKPEQSMRGKARLVSITTHEA